MPNSGDSSQKNDSNEALWMLQHPVVPIFRMVQFLYLTGPFKVVEEIVAEMVEPIETNTARYENPPLLLQPYLPIMKQIENLKKEKGDGDQAVPKIVDEHNKSVNKFTAMESWVGQQLLNAELEKINSMLCGPCGCVLCCVGPDYDADPDSPRKMKQDFFEIPLTDEETDRFDLPKSDNAETRSCTANSEPSMMLEGRPFFHHDPAIYHWQNGWTMILPRKSICPQLAPKSRLCSIYGERPEVCRRPQIFPYLIEKTFNHSAYVVQNKMLAVWDCPYVKNYKQEIAAYAEVCGLAPVFMENKG